MTALFLIFNNAEDVNFISGSRCSPVSLHKQEEGQIDLQPEPSPFLGMKVKEEKASPTEAGDEQFSRV
jgi:hypothetical protein